MKTNHVHKPVLDEIRSCIEQNQHFLLTSHIRTDGDGVCSLLVFAGILDFYKKDYVILLDDQVPDKFDFLPSFHKIQSFDSAADDSEPDVIVSLDASDPERLGRVKPWLQKKHATVINIDHHPGNTAFGHINLIDAQKSGAVELVYDLLAHCGVPVTVEIATLVYTGIMCDTGRFLFPNTTPECLALSAFMVEKGASPDRIGENVYYRKTPETIQAMAHALSTMEMHYQGAVACIHLCNGYYSPKEKIDTEGFIDYLLMIDSTEVSFFILENEPGSYRVSLRSKNHVDVNLVAREFGGGGHKQASGCTVTGSVEAIKEKILKVLETQLRV